MQTCGRKREPSVERSLNPKRLKRKGHGEKYNAGEK